MDSRPKGKIFWRIHTDGQYKHEKILNTYLSENPKLKPQCNITSHLSEWLSSKRKQITNAIGVDVKKKGSSHFVDGNVCWYGHYWKQCDCCLVAESRSKGLLKKLKIELTYDLIQKFNSWVSIQKKIITLTLKRYMSLNVHCSIICNCQDMETT